jgi:hypothetical protein
MEEYYLGEPFKLPGHKLVATESTDGCKGCFLYRKIGLHMGCM